jgi:signal transduction histidine kinase
METAVLLISEAVSNAVRHGNSGRAIKLTIKRGEGRLRIAVRNEGRFRPRPRRSEVGGWGLVLMQRLATHWGIEVGETSVEIWFEL